MSIVILWNIKNDEETIEQMESTCDCGPMTVSNNQMADSVVNYVHQSFLIRVKVLFFFHSSP